MEKPSLLDVPLPLGKIMFEEDHAVLEEVKAFLQSQPWAGEYEIFFSDRTLLEVTARGATKGGMVARLAERLGISAEQLAYVTNSEPGHGLLFFNNVILPFADDFPKDTELYKLLTTKPSEVEHAAETEA